jgi:hypothetical protein
LINFLGARRADVLGRPCHASHWLFCGDFCTPCARPLSRTSVRALSLIRRFGAVNRTIKRLGFRFLVLIRFAPFPFAGFNCLLAAIPAVETWQFLLATMISEVCLHGHHWPVVMMMLSVCMYSWPQHNSGLVVVWAPVVDRGLLSNTLTSTFLRACCSCWSSSSTTLCLGDRWQLKILFEVYTGLYLSELTEASMHKISLPWWTTVRASRGACAPLRLSFHWVASNERSTLAGHGRKKILISLPRTHTCMHSGHLRGEPVTRYVGYGGPLPKNQGGAEVRRFD